MADGGMFMYVCTEFNYSRDPTHFLLLTCLCSSFMPGKTNKSRGKKRSITSASTLPDSYASIITPLNNGVLPKVLIYSFIR